nr:TIGR04222 domain-containing membrane protein [Kibdelosporangium sp. MJ126-NF4]CEL14646.1 hypothetical protein [Kibdelosporangium sp. MJ126-NF4]CTQ96725.1 hypothetical protein [Kibdelosporangium sp. MJ126-NF4]
MGNPWGISGPAFLWLYSGGLVLAGIITLALRRRAWSTGTANLTEPLTVDEMAFAAGGRTRMVESAIANLVDHGAVRIERSGQLHAVAESPYRPESELEERLVGDITQRPGRMMDYYQRRAMRLPLYDQVRDGLERRGLYVRDVGRGALFLAASPLAVLLVIGVVRAVNGASLGYPIGYLTMLIILTGVALGFALRPVRRGPVPQARKVLRGGGHTGTSAAALVARGGMVAYPDPLISQLFRAPQRRTAAQSYRRAGQPAGSAGFSLGGGCSSGGGSSCSGGGSSGGGGCGGGGGS